MWISKKARHGEPKDVSTVSVFSNTLSDGDVEAASPRNPPPGNNDGFEYAPVDGITSLPFNTATALPPYQEDVNDVSKPEPAKRRRTGSTLRSTASTIWYKTRDRVSYFNVPRLAAPWEHEITEKEELNAGGSNTVRDFDYRRQRRRLFVNSAFQWGITASICVALVAVLWRYSHFTLLSQTQKHAFNALVTGLSILLGLNLASSLSGYAQMMRWRLLAAKYRNLQDFELIMNSDSQMKVVRLVWAGRTQGRWWIPNKTQILAITWLLINVALQVFTALLGLTYSVDTSSEWFHNQLGNVSTVDLSYVHNFGFTNTDFNDQAGAANAYGITGQNYGFSINVAPEDQTDSSWYYTDIAQDTFWYRFGNQNPFDATEIEITDRTVATTATCEKFKVLSGGYATSDSVTYYDHTTGKDTTLFVPIAFQSPGCGTWMSYSSETCGPRCTTTMLLLSSDNYTADVPVPLFFKCNNIVAPVQTQVYYANLTPYEIGDEQARAWAGSIGFSGIENDGAENLQYVLYEFADLWSPSGGSTVDSVAQLMMWFTAGGIAADDTGGPRVNVTGYFPVQAQVVDVEWTWAIALLAGIPGCQFLVLLAVLKWANKVIIKDTSHLATARLLRPVVEKLGERGCLLTGDEIADVLGNYRLKYGVREPPAESMSYTGLGGDVVRHVDVIEEVEGLGRADARMINGLYDGTSTWGGRDSMDSRNSREEEREPLLRKRRGRRMSL